MLDVTNDTALPVVFGLQVGDTVAVQTDVLAELARHAPGLPPTWLMLPAGTEGKLLGYRDRAGEPYALVEIALERKLVMIIREHKLVSAPRPAPPTPMHRRPSRRAGSRHSR
ncbi:MAG TPA: hypothetical protein VMZ53_22210 [Kofleriaceae bacterium]|nr:hypothetical protein [Kofleriaceae bacterium]